MPSICISLSLHIVVVLNISHIFDDYKLVLLIFLNESCYFVLFSVSKQFSSIERYYHNTMVLHSIL